MKHRMSKGRGSLYERSGKWYWRRSGTTADGQRRQWSEGPFTDRDEAERARQSPAAVTSVEMESITWPDWIDIWFSREEARLRLLDQDSYADILDRYFRLHLRPNLSGRVAATTPDDLNRLWTHLVKTTGLGASHVRNIRSALGKCFIAAQAEGLNRPNPVKASTPPQEDWRKLVNGDCRVIG